jgi:hypothetical protein
MPKIFLFYTGMLPVSQLILTDGIYQRHVATSGGERNGAFHVLHRLWKPICLGGLGFDVQRILKKGNGRINLAAFRS